MAVGNRRKERADWVRKSLEEYREQLRERENRTAALYDALTDFTRALDAVRPLVQDYTRDYGVSRREIGEQFGLTHRRLSALFEPLIDADMTADDVEPRALVANATSVGSASQLDSMSVTSVGPVPTQIDYLSDRPQHVYLSHC